MRIVKDETPGFEEYKVTIMKSFFRYSKIWRWRVIEEKKEVEISLMIEADDKTGRLSYQMINDKREPLFTNGVEEIALDNTVKLLLLVPPIREAFLKSGFVPKVVVTYEKSLKILNKNPTVSMAVNLQQEIAPGAEA